MHVFVPFAQGLPSSAFGFEHIPVANAQTPISWHSSKAVHTTLLLPVHAPAWQVSVCVQRLPSLHVTPLVFGVTGEHVPVAGTQAPTSWH